MDPNTILQIIRLTLEIAADAVAHMPEADKAAFWARHDARIAFWEKVLGKVASLASEP